MPIITTISYGPQGRDQSYYGSKSTVKTASPFTRDELEVAADVLNAFEETQSPRTLLLYLTGTQEFAAAHGVAFKIEVIEGTSSKDFKGPVVIRVTTGATEPPPVQTVMPPMWTIDP